MSCGQLKNPLDCSRAVLNIFIDLSESCKLISVQICLHLLMNAKNLQCKCHFSHAVWKHGPMGMCPKTGVAWGSTSASALVVPTSISSPRATCIRWDGPSHTPTLPGVGDGDLGSRLCTDELTEEIHWFQEEKCHLELHLRKGGCPWKRCCYWLCWFHW